MIFDTGLIISIIAINMTVIGLTSLAEMKNVIGIDYGRFLLKKYKIFGVVRVYHLLIGFGIINVVSIFLIFVQQPSFRLVHFIVLLISLIFAIYYFFAYIIVESNRVKKQIYELELLGLYYSSDEVTSFEADFRTRVCNGSRTTKKLSGNIINYFNIYNSDTFESFVEIFGPDSMIYDYGKGINKKRRTFINKPPYVYRQSIHKCSDISHEFFQLYRYSEIQDKWVLSILDLFDNSHVKPGFDYIRLCNFIRIISQINTFGTANNLFTYKFLEHLFIHYRKALFVPATSMSDAQSDEIRDLALFANDQFYYYMVKTYTDKPDANYLSAMRRTIRTMIDCESDAILQAEDHIYALLDNIMLKENEQLQGLFSEIIGYYYQKDSQNQNKIELEALRQRINESRETAKTNTEEIKSILFSEKPVVV